MTNHDTNAIAAEISAMPEGPKRTAMKAALRHIRAANKLTKLYADMQGGRDITRNKKTMAFLLPKTE